MSTTTATDAGHAPLVRRAMRTAARWAIAASILFALRAATFGPGLTPSLTALLGLDASEALGPVPSSRIDVLDVALLAAIVASLSMAALTWTRHARR